MSQFLLRGVAWVILHVWTQNYPQNVRTCPGRSLQLLTRNERSDVKSIKLTNGENKDNFPLQVSPKGGGGGMIHFVNSRVARDTVLDTVQAA